MDNVIAQVLGTGALPPELVSSLQDAFDAKVAEAREDAEAAVRKDVATRYEQDKATMIAAMDRLITDTLTRHEEARIAEMAKRPGARAKHRNAHPAGPDENRASPDELVTETIAAHVRRIDAFVVRQLATELREFHIDRRALQEQRVRLAAEGRAKLKETQKRFLREASGKVDAFINATLTREMNQLREDLEKNRQNMFGRRIFEAVAAEYLTSHLAEGTEIHRLQGIVESRDTELERLKSRLNETAKAAEQATRKARIAEDARQRTTVMGELLSNLRGEKRSIMESMLEATPTDALRDAFDRLLPVVLNERRPSAAQPPKPVLTETTEDKRAITGDQRSNRLQESAKAENAEIGIEIEKVVRLAGIK